MESFWDRFRCGCVSASRPEIVFMGPGDLISGIRNRCNTAPAEHTVHLGGNGLYPAGTTANSVVLSTDARISTCPSGAWEPPLGVVASAHPLPGTHGADSNDASTKDSPEAGYVGEASESVTAPASARSDASAISETDMPMTEREREKSRLQKLLKDFAKEAVAGFAVNLVNTKSVGRKPHYMFQMDRHLSTFTLRPEDGSTAVESSMQGFSMKEVIEIYKGPEVVTRAPMLGVDANACVGLDLGVQGLGDHRLLFHFDDSYERDKFYTCLQVVRMSVEIKQSN